MSLEDPGVTVEELIAPPVGSPPEGTGLAFTDWKPKVELARPETRQLEKADYPALLHP